MQQPARPARPRLPLWLMIAGVAVATAPLLVSGVVALVTGGSMWDENEGSGAILWLMLLSVPLGVVLVVSASSRVPSWVPDAAAAEGARSGQPTAPVGSGQQ